jgi:hypothetical protein
VVSISEKDVLQASERAPYPGNVDDYLPNTGESQRVGTISTDGGERFGSIPKPDLLSITNSQPPLTDK